MLESFIQKLRDLTVKRRLVELATMLQEDVKSYDDVTELLHDTHRRFDKIVELHKLKKPSRLYERATEIANMILDKQSVPTVTTTYEDLDDIIGGFRKNEYVIIAGRPSMGKTAFLTSILLRLALQKVPVLLISYEMSQMQIVFRVLSYLTGIPLGKLMHHDLDEEDQMKLANAVDALRDAPFYIEDELDPSPYHLRGVVRKAVEDAKVRVVGVDYMQLMRLPKHYESRNQEMMIISSELKRMAKELPITMVALSQLSRNVERREDKRPKLSDLRDSGAIEQDADVVMFLYRDAYYQEGPQPVTQYVDIIVAKNRNGPVGETQLIFVPRYTAFLTEKEYYAGSG